MKMFIYFLSSAWLLRNGEWQTIERMLVSKQMAGGDELIFAPLSSLIINMMSPGSRDG